MHPLSPLFGVVILSGVLTANYFLTAWRLGILRAFGRRASLSWRVVIAGCVAACLPFAGSMFALAMVPTDLSGGIEVSSLQMAVEMSLCGLFMHILNDAIVNWGAPGQAA